jgi:hypothetical protein
VAQVYLKGGEQMELNIEIDEETEEPRILIKTDGWEKLSPVYQGFIAKVVDIQAIMYLMKKTKMLENVDTEKYRAMLEALLGKIYAKWFELR